MAAEPAGPPTVYFITGASRGLGLELVRQLLMTTEATVVAACRAPERATELQTLMAQHPGRAHIIQLDTADEASVKAAASWVDNKLGGVVDVLINNAGVIEKGLKPWHDVDPSEAIDVLKTNVLGPLLVSIALLPALRKGQRKMIAHMSSSLGSVSSVAADVRATVEATQHGTPAPSGPALMANAYPMYKASKAALNMEMLIMARDLAPEGFTVVSLHPGWVATDMGTSTSNAINSVIGEQAMQPALTAPESVKGLLSVLHALGPRDSGTFVSYTGSPVPW